MTTSPIGRIQKAAIWYGALALRLVGVCLNLAAPGQHTLMAPDHPLHRRSSLVDRVVFAGLQYQIGPDTFFRSTPPGRATAALAVLQALQPSPVAEIVDAYCGIGTLQPCRWRLPGRPGPGLGTTRPECGAGPHQMPPSNGFEQVRLESPMWRLACPKPPAPRTMPAARPARKGLPHKVPASHRGLTIRSGGLTSAVTRPSGADLGQG